MTTLRDLLVDFANEARVQALTNNQFTDTKEEEEKAWSEAREDLVDEYIEAIKERIIG